MCSLAEEAHAEGDFVSLARATLVRMLHGLDDLATVVRQGDWLASVDTSLPWGTGTLMRCVGSTRR